MTTDREFLEESYKTISEVISEFNERENPEFLGTPEIKDPLTFSARLVEKGMIVELEMTIEKLIYLGLIIPIYELQMYAQALKYFFKESLEDMLEHFTERLNGAIKEDKLDDLYGAIDR